MDKGAVDALRKSKELVGPLVPIVKDQNGNILSGRHRKYADANWPEVQVQVKDQLHRELLILQYNVQRKVSREETGQRLLRIAKILEVKGVEKERICAEITKLTGFSREYVRQLLPEEYRMVSKAREVGQLVDQTPEPQDWTLKYFHVPLVPEKYDLVRIAVAKAKESWGVQDNGDALFLICKRYLQSTEQSEAEK